MASGFPANMFEGCGIAPSALLAAATADLQLWYYWSRMSHLRCSSVAKKTVLTVMLVGYRLEPDDSEVEPQLALPALPNEIWCRVMEFCTRHSLIPC